MKIFIKQTYSARLTRERLTCPQISKNIIILLRKITTCAYNYS